MLEMHRCRGQVRAWSTDSCSEWLTVWGARRKQQVQAPGLRKGGVEPPRPGGRPAGLKVPVSLGFLVGKTARLLQHLC